MVVAAARASGHRSVEFCADWRQAPERLRTRVREGDAILTLGAGDIVRLAETLAEAGK
jgi:UDP-N-acetylmuramate-alanine ligase